MGIFCVNEQFQSNLRGVRCGIWFAFNLNVSDVDSSVTLFWFMGGFIFCYTYLLFSWIREPTVVILFCSATLKGLINPLGLSPHNLYPVINCVYKHDQLWHYSIPIHCYYATNCLLTMSLPCLHWVRSKAETTTFTAAVRLRKRTKCLASPWRFHHQWDKPSDILLCAKKPPHQTRWMRSFFNFII
jgi:hypothetical protein